jgi:hypothetical protein
MENWNSGKQCGACYHTKWSVNWPTMWADKPKTLYLIAMKYSLTVVYDLFHFIGWWHGLLLSVYHVSVYVCLIFHMQYQSSQASVSKWIDLPQFMRDDIIWLSSPFEEQNPMKKVEGLSSKRWHFFLSSFMLQVHVMWRKFKGVILVMFVWHYHLS